MRSIKYDLRDCVMAKVFNVISNQTSWLAWSEARKITYERIMRIIWDNIKINIRREVKLILER